MKPLEPGSALIGRRDRSRPAWVEDVEQSLPARPQFLLWGNVHDDFVFRPDDSRVMRHNMARSLGALLVDGGYSGLICWDPTDGLSIDPQVVRDNNERIALDFLRDAGLTSKVQDSPAYLMALLRAVVEAPADQLWGVAVLRASRLVRAPASLGPDEHQLFALAERLAQSARLRQRSHLGEESLVYNPVFWIADRDTDLPPWLLPSLRPVAVPLPDTADCTKVGELLLRNHLWYPDGTPRPGDPGFDEVAFGKHLDTYVGSVQGLRLRDLVEVNRLAEGREFTLDEAQDAVRSFRVGVKDNPWRKGPLLTSIAAGTETLSSAVFGQPAAVGRTMDLLRRSAMGLSGAHASSSGNRPRGVLFFAGPTGVGKTELAKAVTKLVFHDPEAYVRFDMSEFKAEGSDQRLIGAPPGYVGYESGGELTSAVRAKPFSLVLFDEIDKAHERLLDKFLQVLEDGRLTDGRGDTVNFSETLIVFTSNRGIVNPDGTLNVDISMPYEEVAERIRAAIDEFFTSEIQRPELLNRLGESIVVFDFIRDEAGRSIFDKMLGQVLARVSQEHPTTVSIDEGVREQLFRICSVRPEYGGRGIGNLLERAFTDPLARALFDPAVAAQLAPSYVVREVRREGDIFSLGIEPAS